MKTEWITPYSTYFLSRYSDKPKVIVCCENKECGKKFVTNIDRKRCSKKCAKKVRKENSKNSTEKKS